MLLVENQHEKDWSGVWCNAFRAFLTLLLCYLSPEVAGALEIHVPQPGWLLWPGCAILVTALLLTPWDLWPSLFETRTW